MTATTATTATTGAPSPEDIAFGATWSPSTRAFVPIHPGASRWSDPPGQLRGINLRSWIILQLPATGTITVAQLVERLHHSGLTVTDRASKAISDALRWETRRGRAVRLERGRYALGRLARTTRHRMRRRLDACHARARTATPITPLNPPSAAISWTKPHQAGIGADPNPFPSPPVVAPTRNTTNTTASTGTHTPDRPPP